MTAQVYFTPEEYLALEREVETKSEYHAGRIYALALLNPTVIVAQDRPLIEHYLRLPDELWLLNAVNDRADIARIETIGCDLPLSDVYAKVEFPPEDRTEGLGGIYRVKEEPVAYAPRPGQR